MKQCKPLMWLKLTIDKSFTDYDQTRYPLHHDADMLIDIQRLHLQLTIKFEVTMSEYF